MMRPLMRPCLALVVVLAACGGQPSSEGSAPQAGAAAAPSATDVPIRFGGLEDIRAAIAEQKGHAVLVNFWATWCPPCVAELPALRDTARAFEPRGARVLGVSLDLLGPGGEREAITGKVRSFLKARELALPTIILEPSAYEAVSKAFSLPGAVPVTLALDRSGKVVDHHLGEASGERFTEMLEKALAGS